MKYTIKVAVEYNEYGSMIYLVDYPGAFTRGKTKEIALRKVQNEYINYLQWLNITDIEDNINFEIVQEQYSKLKISDADTEILLKSEKKQLSLKEYEHLKYLVIKSAYDFYELYLSIPDKDYTIIEPRKTFYGDVPRTANEMYIHTNGVTNFYLNGLNLTIDDKNDIYVNRLSAMKTIDDNINLLKNEPLYVKNEYWTLSKVLRRFIWHDRIHAKAMYKLAATKWESDEIVNKFHFK